MPRSASTASMGSTNSLSQKQEPLLSPSPNAPLPVLVQTEKDEEDDSKPPSVSSGRIWSLSRPEGKWVVLAVVMAVVNGCTFPAVCFVMVVVGCWLCGCL